MVTDEFFNRNLWSGEGSCWEGKQLRVNFYLSQSCEEIHWNKIKRWGKVYSNEIHFISYSKSVMRKILFQFVTQALKVKILLSQHAPPDPPLSVTGDGTQGPVQAMPARYQLSCPGLHICVILSLQKQSPKKHLKSHFRDPPPPFYVRRRGTEPFSFLHFIYFLAVLMKIHKPDGIQ